jgi:hypothetical protein
MKITYLDRLGPVGRVKNWRGLAIWEYNVLTWAFLDYRLYQNTNLYSKLDLDY